MFAQQILNIRIGSQSRCDLIASAKIQPLIGAVQIAVWQQLSGPKFGSERKSLSSRRLTSVPVSEL